MKERIKIYSFLLIIVIIYTLIYFLNTNTQLALDDFTYHYIYESRMPTAASRLVTNPLDIFVSMANHWRLWGGRVTVHFLLQFAFLLGQYFFNIFNSVMFMLLGALIYFHVRGEKKFNIPLLVTIYAVIFLFVPKPGTTILWKSGSANYLWSSVFLLVMTLIYKKHYDDEKKIKDNEKTWILIFLYGLFIGCMNENTGCALLVSIILFNILYKIKYHKIPKWSHFAFIGVLLSYIFLLVSPGNFIRQDIMYSSSYYTYLPIYEKAIDLTRVTEKTIGPILLISILSSIIVFSKKKNIKEYIKEYGLQTIFYIFSFISIYSLVLSPVYYERCWMFAFIFLLIVIGLNINTLYNSKYSFQIKKVMVFLMIALSFRTFKVYDKAIDDLTSTRLTVENDVEYLKSQKEKGIKDIVITTIPQSKSKYNIINKDEFLFEDKDDWLNQWIAKYYGVDSIIGYDGNKAKKSNK